MLESDEVSDDRILNKFINQDKPEYIEQKVNLEAEKYYAIYYDIGWYLGRIISMTEETCIVKFLKENLEQFDWPAHEDKQVVKKLYVFCGPIELMGSGPFTESIMFK